MKRIALLTLFALTGLASPTLVTAETETAVAMFSRCIGKSMTADKSAECVEMRTLYRTKIRDCMATLQVQADALAGSITDNNAHTYKARYLICAGAARQAIGATGH